jgi:hypothetical protein
VKHYLIIIGLLFFLPDIAERLLLNGITSITIDEQLMQRPARWNSEKQLTKIKIYQV